MPAVHLELALRWSPHRSLVAVAPLLLAACGEPPPAAAPPTSKGPERPTLPALGQVNWAPEATEDDGVTLAATIAGGADSVDAVVASDACSTEPVGRGQVTDDKATLKLSTAELATAIQCRGLKVTVSRGGKSKYDVVSFEIQLANGAGATGSPNIQKSPKSPEFVLGVAKTQHNARLTVGNEVVLPRSLNDAKAEFAIPIGALAKAALHKQRLVVSTGAANIEYVPALTVAGQAVAQQESPGAH